MATTLLQVRIDTQTKKEADALFSELGLDTSTAIRVFIKQALKKRAIPFSIKAKSEERTEEEAFYSPENVAQLKQGYKELKAGRGIERELINA